MTSSGMKRGLAATAVSALAVTGLPFLTVSANATTLESQIAAADGVAMYTPGNGDKVSLKNDGQDATVHLLAGGGKDIAAVTFQYKLPGGNPQDIATVSSRNNDGAFSYDWDVPAALVGATVEGVLKFTRKDGTVGSVTGGQVVLSAPGGADESVNLSGDNTALGVFQQPYAAPNNKHLAAVSGTTSSTTTADNVELSWLKGDGTPGGAPVQAAVKVAKDATTGTFAGTLDLTGYAYDVSANPVDQIVVKAVLDSSDAEAYAVKKQVISGITATAEKSQVKVGGTTPVTIKVTDQDGKAIAGAQVYDDLDDSLVGYTDANGVVTHAAGKGAHEYYANATSTTGYEPAFGDKKAPAVTVSEYTPSPKALQAKSADGAAFDFDENGAGDITVTVVDEAGSAYPGVAQQIEYTWTLTPFNGKVQTSKVLTAATDASGKALIPLPSSNDFDPAVPAQTAGTYTLTAGRQGDLLTGNGAIAGKQVLSVKAGHSAVAFDQAGPEQAAAGGEETVAGALKLEDGTALAGRSIALTYTRGTEPNNVAGDAEFKKTATEAAGLSRTVKTDDAGAFSVVVDDLAETPTQPSEKGGQIKAVSGIAGDKTQTVDFLTSLAPASLSISTDEVFSEATPGRPVELEATVKNAAGDTLSNVPVEVSVDRGFLTPFNDKDKNGHQEPWELVPAAIPAENDMVGEWKQLGQKDTPSTDGAGVAKAVVGIERDPGFDDDGEVTLTVTVKAGSVTKTQTIDFDSTDPMNPGQVRLELAEDQDVDVLPNAPVGKGVAYNLYAEDQFGNLTGEYVDIEDNTSKADHNHWGRSQFIDDNPSVWAWGNDAVSQTLTATWDQSDFRYEKVDGNGSGRIWEGSEFYANRDVNQETKATTAAVNWYEVDLSKSVFTLEHDTADTVRVGTAVTETLTVVDQFGEGIPGLDVDFIRSGPGNMQDGDQNDGDTTDNDGVATYNFAGTDAGIARVNAIVFAGNDQIKKIQDEISFKRDVIATLKTSNNRKGNDVVTVNTGAAGDVVVKLFKVNADGSKTKIARKRADNGVAVFQVKDGDKRGKSRYMAVVKGSSNTFATATEARNIR